MTIHFHPIPRVKPKRCDTRALAAARANTLRRLKAEIDEARISAELVEKHNRHVRESREFKQNGGK